MIVRPRPHWLRLLFVRHGSLVHRIYTQQIFIFLIASAVVVAHGQFFQWKVTLTAAPFSLMGLAVAIFLGFRINASYDRFWEARKHWGSVLVEARNLSRQALTLMGHGEASSAFIRGLIAFATTMRNQLRALPIEHGTRELLPESVYQKLIGARSGPSLVLLWLGEQMHEYLKTHRLNPVQVQKMETSLDGLSLALGCCERIANTPLPFSYSVILHRSTYVYCILLPFGLVDAIGWMTPLVATFVSYTFFALEALSDEIEEPFGTSPNDLALDAMVSGIDACLREMLGETPSPAMKPDAQYVLR